ncbi:MAG TPA: hypothetical protein PLH97_07820 [Verrucomicrobiota bacterium]|nr:hypothetical protein [Verrucomicrobiota bacterium]
MPLALFVSRSHGEAYRNRLVESGIPAEIHDTVVLGRFWYASRPASGVRLEVPAREFERAHRKLVEWDDGEGDIGGAIRCPECRSLRISFPQYTRRSFIPNLVIGALAAIGRVEKEFYCDDCHYTWPREGHGKAAMRPHSAPYYFIEDVPEKKD